MKTVIIAILRTLVGLLQSCAVLHLEILALRRLCQLVGNKINKVASVASYKINRRTSPVAMYRTSVRGTYDNDEPSTNDDRR